MDKEIFQPERYGMVICPSCNGQGYIQTPERQCCLKCGGFGFVRKETEKDANTSTNSD
jgi:DnaJ-class molecular chaperone